jgi:hypothetical protein
MDYHRFFDKNALSFFAKNENSFLVFDLDLCENKVKIEKNDYQNTQRKILYKS